MADDLAKFYYDIEQDLFQEPINDLEGFLDCARYNEKDDYQALIEYLNGNPQHIDAADSQGRTAVHMAAANGHMDLLEALYKFHPAPNVPNIEGNTALHFAALNNRVNSARWLMERGWLPSVENNFGKTPIQQIYEKGYEEMEAILVEYDATLDTYVPESGVASVELNDILPSAKDTKRPTVREMKKEGTKEALSGSEKKESSSSSDEEDSDDDEETKKRKEEKRKRKGNKEEKVLGPTDIDGIE